MRHLTPVLALCLLPLPAAAQDMGDDGEGFLTELIEENLSDVTRTVDITGFDGALSSEATIQRLTIADAEGVWLEAEGLSLSWDRRALLSGRLEIDTLRAVRIVLPRAPVAEPGVDLPAAEATPFALPDLPVSINIGSLGADRIELGAALIGEDMVARLEAGGSLAGGAGSVRILAERIDETEGLFEVEVAYSNATQVLSLNTTLTEEAGGLVSRSLGLPGQPSVRFDLDGTGPLTAFDGTLAIATDGTDRISGRFGTAESEGGTAYTLDIAGDVTTLFAPEYRPFFGDDLALAAQVQTAADGSVTLEALNLEAQAVRLTGSAAFGPDGWPAALSLTGEIASADGPTLLPLSGPETRVDSAQLSVRYEGGEAAGWDGTFLLTGLARDGMTLPWLTLTGSGEVTPGDGTPLGRLTANLLYQTRGLTLDDPALAMAIPADITGEVQLVRVEDAPLELPKLTLFGEDIALEAAATLEGGEISADMALRAGDLGRLSGLAGLDLSGSGLVRLGGSLRPLDGIFDGLLTAETDGLAIGVAEVDPLLAGAGRLALAAERDTAGTRITGLTVRTDLAAINGNASLTGSGASGDLTGRIEDIAPVVDGLNGPADLSATGWLLTDGAAEVTLDLTVPEGRITAALERAETGSYAARIDAALSRIAPYAALAGVDVSGGADIEAEASHTPATGATTLSLTGQTTELRVPLTGVNPLLAGRGQLSLSASGVVEDKPRLGNLWSLAAKLDYPAATLALDVEADGAELAVSSSGTLPRLSVLSGLTGQNLRGSGAWTTLGSYDIEAQSFASDIELRTTDLGIGNATLDRLTAGSGTLRSRLFWAGQGRFDLSGLSLVMPNLAAQADIRADGTSGSGSYSARLRDVGLFTDALSGPLSASGTASGGPQGWRIDTALSGPGGATAQITGAVAPQIGLDINGRLPLALLNGVLAPRRLSGMAALNLRADGAALSGLTGTVGIEGAQLSAPTLGQRLDAISGTVTLAGGAARIAMTGSVPAGGGLSLSGPVTLSGAFPADLALELRRIVLRDPSLYETSVSGQLAVTGPLAGGARISGDLAIGRSEIQVPSSTVGALGALPDVTHQNAPAGVRQTLDRAGLTLSGSEAARGGSARPYPLDITVTAPSRVFVRGRGLDAELGGSLRLTGTTANVIPSGQFGLIRGRLDILQQRFDLDEGFARLEGALDPFLRLVARTETEDGTSVAIVIEGPASAPDLSFSSSPELPQDEVLSRLLFGRSVTEISPLQAVQLAGAVGTLAGRGGGGLVAEFRDGLDLDDLDLTTDETGNAAVRAGKYISENVYTEVTVDSAGETEIDLNIDLTDSLTARGTLGADGDTAVGIFFEKDY